VSVNQASDNLVVYDSYHPALSFKYQVPVPLNTLDDHHVFCNVNYASIALALTNNDWFVTFNRQPADISI